MKSEFHKVGMGMPVYNGEQYIEDALKSALSQSFDDFSLHIADNASTDRTQEICQDFASQDSRIHYIRNSINLGAAKNYTVCFEPSNCEYFRWANADDLSEPSLVAKCLRVLEENPDAVLAYGKTRIIGSNGEFLEDYDDNLHLTMESPSARFIQCLDAIGLSNVLYGLVRRDQLAKTALLGNYIASDINLIAELTLYGTFIEIPDTLFSRRMHPEASSWDRSDTETQREFWDPSRKKLFLQKWRRVRAYTSAVSRAELSTAEKLTLYKQITKIAYWGGKPMLTEISDYVRYGLLKQP